ncbi:WXG100 family type VII secretion target [Amycolatopsis anabasis]|uniref:WXG100 family type VII secretion target n=1 Tax=Amycolatopsis anabasis TaxID=1840409 RepID=UPI00131CC6BF|nr:PPE domain-containing protein [Amycolatopsis anabasis]
MTLKYNKHRKKRYYHDDHPLSRKAKLRKARLERQRRANLKDSAFGKINWDAYEHRQLWDMIKSAEPGAMGQRAHDWAKLASNVDSATKEVQKTLQELLLSWRGKSAVTAAESSTQLTTWASEASQTARHIGEGLDTYTAAVAEAKKKIPEPVHPYLERWFREGYDINALSGPNGAYLMNQLLDDHLPSKQEATRAKQEAVRVMDEYESASKTVHGSLPGFQGAPAVTQGGTFGATEAPPGSGGSPAHDPAESTTASSAVTVDPSLIGAGTGGPGPGGTGYGSTGSGPGAMSGVGGTGGYGGGPGASGPGMATGSGVPGGGMVGPFAANAGAAGARGGPGMGGFGMYPPMAGAGNSEEDKEHTNRYDLGLDLMDDLPPAYPPVFGQ